MKTDKYRDIEWKNPWKVFERGTLPIGLAIAYREKHGYDPLKACRLYLWLDHVRVFAWQWLVMAVIGVFLSIPAIDQRGISGLKPILQIPVVRYAIMFTIGLVLVLIFTRKAYKQNRQRMWEFQRATYSFVFAFSSMFEDEPSAIKASMGRDELLAEVSKDMTRTAQAVVEGEITGHEAATERYQLGQKSSIANTFGLGSEWSAYFNEARKAIDPYELFAWEI